MHLISFAKYFAPGYLFFSKIKDPHRRSDIHAYIAVFLSLLNIKFNLFQSSKLMGLSSSYMAYELTTFTKNDLVYIIHHLVALFAVTHIWFGNPKHLELKTAEYFYLIESTNPFLNIWDKNPTKRNFFMFIYAFIIVRVLYLGYLVKWMKEEFNDIYSKGASLFYIGMLSWAGITIKNNSHYFLSK